MVIADCLAGSKVNFSKEIFSRIFLTKEKKYFYLENFYRIDNKDNCNPL